MRFAAFVLIVIITVHAGSKAGARPTQGVPTVSVMDMDIQERENDLVLGTHGRSIFVIDDYAALRGLREADFEAPLKLLSVTAGQQYISMRAPSGSDWRIASSAGSAVT